MIRSTLVLSRCQPFTKHSPEHLIEHFRTWQRKRKKSAAELRPFSSSSLRCPLTIDAQKAFPQLAFPCKSGPLGSYFSHYHKVRVRNSLQLTNA
jgi:hypothetical protein